MADGPNPLPPASVGVLDANNALTLPWRRALQTTGANAASGITALIGEVVASGPGVATAAIAASGVTAGTYSNLTATIGPDGRITHAQDGTAGDGTEPLTPVMLSLLDGWFTTQAAYRLARPRSFTWTGDATGGPTSFDGSADVTTALSLAATAVTPGTYGDATHVGQFTVDAKGRLTFAQSVAISGGGGGSWFPLTNGVEPPAMISNGAGVPIAVAYAP